MDQLDLCSLFPLFFCYHISCDYGVLTVPSISHDCNHCPHGEAAMEVSLSLPTGHLHTLLAALGGCTALSSTPSRLSLLCPVIIGPLLVCHCRQPFCASLAQSSRGWVCLGNGISASKCAQCVADNHGPACTPSPEMLCYHLSDIHPVCHIFSEETGWGLAGIFI